MLTYSFDKRGGQSLYEYLYNCMKTDIINGVLSPNEKLPSKRAFASNHGISIVTVENTYGQLMAEGYIYSKPKSGFFVSPIQSQITSTSNESDLIETKKAYVHDNSINLVSNHTAPENFPFSIWAKLTRQILSEQSPDLLVTPPAGGVPELRTAIARHLHEFRGINASPEQIMIGAGTEYLYGLIVQLLGRDLVYGLENPSSKKIRSIYEALGVKVAPLEMDEEGIQLDARNLTIPDIIQISPSHHFPTGIVTSVSRRYGLLQWANESNSRYIIEDDYDSEFRYHGKPIPAMQGLDDGENVIYMGTFSKAIAPAIRASYMVLPKKLAKRYQQIGQTFSCAVSRIDQKVLTLFLTEGHFERHLNRMRNIYKEKHDLLIKEIKKLNSDIQIYGHGAGAHIIVRFPVSDQKEFQKKLRQKGVMIYPLSWYYIEGKPLKEEYILGFTRMKKEDMIRGIEIIGEVLYSK